MHTGWPTVHTSWPVGGDQSYSVAAMSSNYSRNSSPQPTRQHRTQLHINEVGVSTRYRDNSALHARSHKHSAALSLPSAQLRIDWGPGHADCVRTHTHTQLLPVWPANLIRLTEFVQRSWYICIFIHKPAVCTDRLTLLSTAHSPNQVRACERIIEWHVRT
jgi:hypothetical protein